MSAPLNIIDALERLREAWERAGGPALLAGLPGNGAGDGAPASERVAGAWVQAVEGRAAEAGGPQRRLRRLARALAGDEVLNEASPEYAALLKHGEPLRGAIESARRDRLWPLSPGAAPEPVAELARRWGALAPAMSPLRAWRMIARMGAPAVAPEPALRRFFWRLGAVESADAADATFETLAAVAAGWCAAAQLSHERLEAMLLFHTRAGAPGGGHCAARPRCADCPFVAACAWARFHARPGGEEAPEAGDDAMEPVRRRLAEGREESLETAELLAVLLGGGGPGLAAARALLKKFDSLQKLETASVEDLAQTRGVGGGRAAALKAALELGRRAARRELFQGGAVGCAQDVADAYRARFRTLPQEHFIILMMDAKHRVIGEHVVSRGTLTSSLAHPREVFREAVRRAAAAVILLHNHPSGDPAPSAEDNSVTRRLQDAGEILGIRVLDHVILGEEGFYSYKDEVW